MNPSRRGFFRALLALPFASKYIQAFRPKTRIGVYSASCGEPPCAASGIALRPALQFHRHSFRLNWPPVGASKRVASLHAEGGTLRVTWEDGGTDTVDGQGFRA